MPYGLRFIHIAPPRLYYQDTRDTFGIDSGAKTTKTAMDFTSLYDINNALQGTSELETSGVTQKVPTFLRPFHFVLLGLTLSRCRTRNFSFNDFDAGFVRYASRMHLWDAVGLESPVTVREHDSLGRFHPLTALDNPETVGEVSKDLAHLFGDPGNETTRSIDNAVTELVGNSYSHSSIVDGLRGFVCAQKWAAAGKAQIAIGDSGIGIRESLAAATEYAAILSTQNSCELATGYEVTSKRGKGHSGYGLTLARDLIANNRGAFFLLSGSEYYSCKHGVHDRGNLPVSMPGTLAVIEWNTSVPLSAKAVYDSWPSPLEDDYDDFDF